MTAPSSMRRAAVFVMSDVRSGSTLLDQCLGGHPDVASLGELHWLRAYLHQDRTIYDPVHPLVCSCGLPVPACPFWTSVELALGRPLESLDLSSHLGRRQGEDGPLARIVFLPKRIVKARPRLVLHPAVQRMLGSRRIARDCVDLFDAVSAATARAFCVDSSKSPFRFRMVRRLEPAKTLGIVMARDFRAVVHSKMKRGAAMDGAAIGWRRRMDQIDALTQDLPPGSVHRLKYEDFCQQPRQELERICAFMGVEFVEPMLQRPTGDVHHIGGSPSKFDATRTTISLDRSYEGAFSAEQTKRLRRLVGDAATRWGY